MKLSIIIPMYNVELYIEKCLLSCLKQDIPSNDYEIIVVNDGSSDGSLYIAEQVASRVNNIKIISQPNGGLSAARNRGLSLANGDYIWFVDSDDWIEENCLSDIYELLNGIDIIAISYYKVINGLKIQHKVNTVYSGKTLLKTGFFQPIQFYIIRKELLINNKLIFMHGVYHEDLEFTPRMLYFSNSIYTYSKCIYNHLSRYNSITSIPKPKRAFDLIIVSESLYKFNEKIHDVSLKCIFYNLISLALNNALSIIVQADKQCQFNWINSINERKYLLSSYIKSNIVKYKFWGIIIHIQKNKLIQQYRFLQKINRILKCKIRSCL